VASVASTLTWEETKFMIVFGDSYTTTGFNISAGVNSPDPGFTASNGDNWVQYLRDVFNVTDTRVFNLAVGGAVTDNNLVTPFMPNIPSLVDQTNQFVQFLAPKPAGAQWSSNNTLFAIWIGINDVGNSWSWTNVTQSGFHHTIMDRYFAQVEKMYQGGARSFLFLSVPPIDRSPLFIEQGRNATRLTVASLADYNGQLAQRIANFKRTHHDLQQVTLFDTGKIFNTLLDNAGALGFVNATGFADPYQNGTPEKTTQTPPFAPVSSYFWLNSLHPLYTVHYSLAHAISTILSGF